MTEVEMRYRIIILEEHLRGIEKTANHSRTQSRRMRLIAARCRSALEGNYDWLDLPQPRKAKKDDEAAGRVVG